MDGLQKVNCIKGKKTDKQKTHIFYGIIDELVFSPHLVTGSLKFENLQQNTW